MSISADDENLIARTMVYQVAITHSSLQVADMTLVEIRDCMDAVLKQTIKDAADAPLNYGPDRPTGWWTGTVVVNGEVITYRWRDIDETNVFDTTSG